MTDEKAPLEFLIQRDLLLDILSTGIEHSAAGFWAQVEEFKWEWWYAAGDTDLRLPSPDLTEDTVLMRVRDDSDGLAEKEQRPFVDITLKNLNATTLWALANRNDILPFRVTDNVVTDIDYDVVGADIIVQRIVLGEVVYG